MTVLHLAARYGHVDVLEVLRGKVPWNMASVKVVLLIIFVLIVTTITPLPCKEQSSSVIWRINKLVFSLTLSYTPKYYK